MLSWLTCVIVRTPVWHANNELAISQRVVALVEAKFEERGMVQHEWLGSRKGQGCYLDRAVWSTITEVILSPVLQNICFTTCSHLNIISQQGKSKAGMTRPQECTLENTTNTLQTFGKLCSYASGIAYGSLTVPGHTASSLARFRSAPLVCSSCEGHSPLGSRARRSPA